MVSQLAELAVARESIRSLGLVTGDELAREGWTDWRVRHALRGGALVRVSPGLFLESPPSTAEERWLQGLAAVVLRTAPDGVVAGSAAAALRGLDGFDHLSAFRVEVPATRRSGGTRDKGIVVRTRNPADPVWIGAFPVTGIARTLTDLADRLAPRPRWPEDRHPIGREDLIELAVESALRRRMVTMTELEHSADTGRPAGAALRRVLARRPPGAPPTESYLETRCVQMLRGAGFDDPERQVEVRDGAGRFIGRVDLCFDQVLIECDGRETHDTPEAFVKDRERWSQLQAEGYSPLVLTYQQIERNPRPTCDLVSRTLVYRRSLSVPAPRVSLRAT